MTEVVLLTWYLRSCKSTILKWVKFTIKNAYNSILSSQSRLLKIKPHELRALSTSWAYLNFICMEEIIKSCCLFKLFSSASHYLRDFKDQSENLHKVGPLSSSDAKGDRGIHQSYSSGRKLISTLSPTTEGDRLSKGSCSNLL